MLNIRLIDILEVGNEYTKNLPLAFFVGVLFIAEIFSILPFTTNNLTFIDLFLELYYIFSPVSGVQNSIDLSPSIFITYTPDFIVGNFTQIASLGQGLYTYGAMWLIVVSLILLLAMVAAITITSNSSQVQYKSSSSPAGVIKNKNENITPFRIFKRSYHSSSNRSEQFLQAGSPEVENNYDSSADIHPWDVTGLTDAKFISIKQFSTKNNHLSLAEATSSKAMVVWWTNLSSSVGKGRFTKQISGMIKIPPYQLSVIIGLLLSDGWLIIASATNKNARLGFKQSLEKGIYVWFVFNELSHYCSSYPNLTKGIRAEKPFYGLEFFTRSLPCFSELHSLFYPKGIKIIPNNIYDILTPVALAHLIMGDGKLSRHGLIICADSFSVEDVVRLINVLIVRYRLECTIRYDMIVQIILEFILRTPLTIAFYCCTAYASFNDV